MHIRFNFKRNNKADYLHVAVVRELVVRRKCYKTTPSGTQRKKYLYSGVSPYLQVYLYHHHSPTLITYN